MSSRQEEKEQRRRERLEKEAAEARAAARARRLQLLFGGVLLVGLLAAVAIAIASGVGGDDETSGENGARTEVKNAVKLPEPKHTDLEAAVEASGCKLVHAKFEGAGHEEKQFTTADFKSNPPTSGAHFPEWYDDGIYEPGSTDNLGMLVHTLEHGRVNLQYRPGAPKTAVQQLEAVFNEKTGYHMLLYENGTKMPYLVAATAWTQLLGCNELNPDAIDAFRLFYQRYVDKGPEQVP